MLGALTKRQILVGHAELLAGVPPATQEKVLAGVVAHQVTVTVLKKQLGQYARRLADAIFDTARCAGCIYNSARQAGLFAESLGDGYCQHPTHFVELTMQVIEAKAVALKDEYQVIRIVKPSDGFQALHLTADGELGVGAEQYSACKGCRSFGCAVSAMPGSYGYVTESSVSMPFQLIAIVSALRPRSDSGSDACRTAIQQFTRLDTPAVRKWVCATAGMAC